MTDEELNAIGQGIVLHLKKSCSTPGDALSVCVYILLILWSYRPDEQKGDFEQFINGFRDHCLNTWKLNDPEAQPTEYKLQ